MMKYRVNPENNIITFEAYNKNGHVWHIKYYDNGHTFSRLTTVMFICNEFKFNKKDAIRALLSCMYKGYQIKETKK